jgi:hypothetical protein
MLTSRTKRGSVLAVVAMTLLTALTSGTMTVQAQDGVTLTPGAGASPQDTLLAEALGAAVQAGFDPADFDIEKAVFDPRGRAMIMPIKDLQTRLRAKELPILIGVLYVRESLSVTDLQELLRVDPKKFKVTALVDHVRPGLYPIEVTRITVVGNGHTRKPTSSSGPRITLFDSVTTCFGVSVGTFLVFTAQTCYTKDLGGGNGGDNGTGQAGDEVDPVCIVYGGCWA